MSDVPEVWTTAMPVTAIQASIGLHGAALAAAVAMPGAWPWAAAAAAANHLLLGAAGMVPQSRVLGPNLTRLPANRPEVALTFDDGPDPAVTPLVLDLLDAAGAKATFFCIGGRARAHPELVREIARRGHAVENHTDTHPYGFAALPPPLLRREVRRAQATLAELTGRQPRFLRAPAGLRSPLLDPVLRREGLLLASWTRRALDGVSRDPGAALRRLLRGLAPGDILLLHDGNAARTPAGTPVVLSVLPRLLPAMRAAGLRPVPLTAAD